MANDEWEPQFSTRASADLVSLLNLRGLEFVDLRSATSQEREQTSELLTLVQARADAVFAAFEGLPHEQAPSADTAIDTRTLPFGDGARLQRITTDRVMEIHGPEFQVVDETILVDDASLAVDSSPEERTIVRRTEFKPSIKYSPEILHFEPTGRILLIGYRGRGFTGLPRLEIVTFSNRRESVALFKSGASQEYNWKIPGLGRPTHRHEYLMRTFGLDQDTLKQPMDAKDLYNMFMQIVAEQARIENTKLKQELWELRRDKTKS